jgi:hypothetical protein
MLLASDRIEYAKARGWATSAGWLPGCGRLQTFVESLVMTFVLVTHDSGVCGAEIAANIAAGLRLDLISEEQLGCLVAQRMQIDPARLERLIIKPPAVFARWLGEHRRLKWSTAQEIAKLAARGDIVVASWSSVAAVYRMPPGVRVHIGDPARLGARPGRQVTISLTQASPWLWLPGGGRGAHNVCDLKLPSAQSVTSCVDELRRLALSKAWHSRQFSPPALVYPADAMGCQRHRADSGGAWPKCSLEVEIGADRMALVEPVDDEEAIAQIEEHLHGKPKGPALRRLPLPPGTL